MRTRKRTLAILLHLCSMFHASLAYCDVLPEYRLKAIFLYNFIVFTEWPDLSDTTINLCFDHNHPFGSGIDELNDRKVHQRSIRVLVKSKGEHLRDCQAIFISNTEIGRLSEILALLRDQSILTIADSKDSAEQGVMLNMQVENEKITFEANLIAVRQAGLILSSRLLRLATKVIQ